METKKAIKELSKRANIKSGSLKERVMDLLFDKKFDKATEEIVKHILSTENIYTTRDDNKREVWIYKEGIYIPKGKSFIKEICRDILGRAYTEIRANHIIGKIEVDTFIDEKDFFKNDDLLEVPVENGILNIETRKLSNFSPNKIFFNKLPVQYDEKANCDLIDKFLSDVLSNEEDRKVIYELGGFGLYREYFIEKAVMMIGKGRNGKGKTLELLKRFVGAENCCSVSLEAMEYKSTAVCELYNRLLNLGGDLDNTSLKKTGLFKNLTGRDTVQTKRKYLRDLIFQNYAKHIFACNSLPKVYDNSEGFWDRWILLEFPFKFVVQKEYDKLSVEEKKTHKILNPVIIDEISTPKQMSGFLNKCLDALKEIRKVKDFSSTKATKEIKEFWIRNSDSFRSFCMDCLEESPMDFILKEVLRQKYLAYRKKHKLKKGESDYSIKATLQELFGADEQRKSFEVFHNKMDTPKFEMKNVWLGIKLK